MAITLGLLEIVMKTDLDQFTGGMRTASQVVDQTSARMTRAVSGATDSVTSLERTLGGFRGGNAFQALTISALRAEDSLSRLRNVALLLPAAIGGVGAAAGSKALMDYADQATTVRNRLAVLTDQQSQRVAMEREVFEIAQRTRSSYGATAQLFSRTTQAAQQLGRSQGEVGRFVETVSMTSQISGSSTQEANAAAIQLAQGLSSNRLQGDELRSILENNVALAQLLARELAGGSVGRLREMGTEGLLTAQQVMDAVLRGSTEIRRQFEQTQATFANSFVIVNNALVRYVGQVDQALGASQAFFNMMQSLADNLPAIAGGIALITSALVALGAVKIGGALIGAVASARNAGNEGLARALDQARGRLASLEAERNAAASVAASARSEASRAATGQSLSVVSQSDRSAYLAATTALNKAETDLINNRQKLERLEERRADLATRVAAAESAATAQGVANSRTLLREKEALIKVERDIASATRVVDRTNARLPELRAAPGVQIANATLENAAAAERARLATVAAEANRNLAVTTENLARAQNQVATASAAVDRGFGTMAGAANVARGVFGSLYSFLGGPWGVALTGLTVALAAVGLSHANAALRAKEQEDALARIPRAIDEITAAQQRQQAITPQQAISGRADAAAGEQAISGVVDQLRSFTSTSLFGGNFNRDLGAAFARSGRDIFEFDDRLRDARGNVTRTQEVIVDLRKALESIGASRADLSQPVAEMLRLIARVEEAIGGVRRLQGALNGGIGGVDIEGVVSDRRQRQVTDSINGSADAFQSQFSDRPSMDTQIQNTAAAIRQQRVLREEIIRNNARERGGRAALLEQNRRAAREEFAGALQSGSISNADIERLVQSRTPNERRQRNTEERWTPEERVTRELSDALAVASNRMGRLDEETLRYARSARIADEEQRKFIEAITSGNLDAAPEKFKRIREQVEAIARARLNTDLLNERSDMFLDPTEQKVAQRLRAAGLTEANASAEASQIRLNEQLSMTKGLFNDAFSGIGQQILQGASAADILSGSLQRVAGSLLRVAEQWLAVQAFNGIMGLFGQGPVATGPPTNLISGIAGLFGSQSHDGGIAGSSSWGPRTHWGRGVLTAHSGFGPDEIPAVLQKGEAVLSRQMTNALPGTMSGLTSLAETAGGAVGGISRMEVSLSPGLVGSILEQAAGHSVQITSGAIKKFSAQVPGIVADSERRRP